MANAAIIVPYFGTFPNYFSFWLDSVSLNDHIDFIIITDISTSEFKIPQNVRVLSMNFHELVKKIQSNYPFTISCSSPYKLCDFRPAYGEIFRDLLEGYEYWGYCDTDVIFGDLKAFIDIDRLNCPDKILSNGHLTLIRNSGVLNNYYMRSKGLEYLTYKYVFSSRYSCHFDEGEGIGKLMDRGKARVYKYECFLDLKYDKRNFYDQLGVNLLYVEFKEGKLFAVYHDKEVEIAYAHFQKRKLTVDKSIENTSNYRIYPNLIVDVGKEIQVTKEPIINLDYLLFKINDVKGKLRNGYFEYKIRWILNKVLTK